MTFLLVTPDGNITELPASTSFDDIRVKHVGNWCEMVTSNDEVAGTKVSAYVDEEAKLKASSQMNPLASLILGREILNNVVFVGPYDSAEERDTGLTPSQVTHIKQVAHKA